MSIAEAGEGPHSPKILGRLIGDSMVAARGATHDTKSAVLRSRAPHQPQAQGYVSPPFPIGRGVYASAAVIGSRNGGNACCYPGNTKLAKLPRPPGLSRLGSCSLERVLCGGSRSPLIQRSAGNKSS